MNSRALSGLALVAGAFAIFIGLWGLISPGAMQSADEIQQSIRWAGAGMLAVAVSTVANALAGRGRPQL